MTAINANTNITSTVANSLSSLKLNNAAKAFVKAQRPVEEIEQEIQLQIQEDKSLIDNKSAFMEKFSPTAIEEMKKISEGMGEELTNEDIQYGLKYGRSVIADYSV